MANVPTDLFNVVMEYAGPTIDSFEWLPVTQVPYVTVITRMEKLPPDRVIYTPIQCAYVFVWDTKTFSDKNKINGTHSE